MTSTLLMSAGSALCCAPAAGVMDRFVAARARLVPVNGADEPELAAAGPAVGIAAAAVPAMAVHPTGAAPAGRRRQRTIPARTWMVALSAAGLAAAQAAHTGGNWLLPAQLVLLSSLCALAAGDIEWLLLPRVPVWATTAACGGAILAGAASSGEWRRLQSAVVCSAVLTGLLAVVSIVNPRWMGFGDVRLAVPLGLVLGWTGGGDETVLAMLLANVAGGLAALAFVASRRLRLGDALPFGAFLAAGTAAALLLR